MRPSPIQLLDTTLLRVDVEPIQDKLSRQREGDGPFVFDNVVIQTSRGFQKAASYWEGAKPPAEGVDQRTFAITLGVRTPSDSENVGPYRFEIAYGGVVAIIPSTPHAGMTIEDMAYQYGLTMLYGIIRETFSNLTAKMEWGHCMLPTMSFLDERLDALASSVAKTNSK